MGITNNIFTEPVYYLEFSAAITFPESLTNPVTFNYSTESSSSETFDGSGVLVQEWATLEAFIAGLNGAQSVFFFYEITGDNLKKIGTGNTVIGVKKNDYFPNHNYLSGGTAIDWDGGQTVGQALKSLYPNNTSSDQLLQQMVTMNGLLDDIKTNTTP